MNFDCSPTGEELDDVSIGHIFTELMNSPYDTFVVRWNWKAALLSAGTRAPMFLLTTLGRGWRSASLAMLVEAAFRASSTGFFAAATQAFRKAKPVWAALLVMLTGFPLLTLALDGLLHLAMHTPNLRMGLAVSLAMSALSSAFDWYIMRRGTLLMGEEGSSFWSDIKALPGLAFAFLLAPSIWAWRSTRQWLAEWEAE